MVFVGVDGGGRLDWQVDQVANADVRHDMGSEVLIEALEMSEVPGIGEMDEGQTGLVESLQGDAVTPVVATWVLKVLLFCF